MKKKLQFRVEIHISQWWCQFSDVSFYFGNFCAPIQFEENKQQQKTDENRTKWMKNSKVSYFLSFDILLLLFLETFSFFFYFIYVEMSREDSPFFYLQKKITEEKISDLENIK
jgi:hypothetical protein